MSVLIELSPAPWTVGGAREQTRTRHSEATARAEARELVIQERDQYDRRHGDVQYFRPLGQRIREAGEQHSRAGDEDEMPLFLALMRGAPREEPQPDAEGDPDGGENRKQITRAHGSSRYLNLRIWLAEGGCRVDRSAQARNYTGPRSSTRRK